MPVFVNTTFEVRVQAYPSPTYQWYIGDEEDPEERTPLEEGIYSGVTSRVLSIPDVTSDLNGNSYSCKVTNSVGSTWSELAVLTVHYEPYIATQPVSQEVSNGGVLNLLVEYQEGNPTETTFQWYKDDVALVDDARISGATEDALTITDFGPSDVGDYHCTVSNTVGTATSNDAVIGIINPFDESFWACSNGFAFDPEDGIAQLFTDVGDAYAVYHVANVENLVLAYTCLWKDGGNFSSSGAVCYNGIGIKPVTGGAICDYPAGIDGVGAYGCWQLKTQGCFSGKTTTFIGRNNLFPYYSGCILDTGVVYTSNVSITVGPHLGGNLYDITIHLVVADASIDETYVFENIYFQDGEGQIMIGGLQSGTDPLYAAGYQQYISQLDILEQD